MCKELFSTARLSVRRLTKDDAEAMEAVYGDPEAMRFVGDGKTLTAENCAYWVEVTDRNFKNRGYGMVGAFDPDSSVLIGCAGIVHPNNQEQAEVKYAIRRDRWGQGYASELVSGLLNYARSELGLFRLMATVYPEHLKSQAVLRKNGFHHAHDRENDDGSITQVWESDPCMSAKPCRCRPLQVRNRSERGSFS